MMKKKIQQKQHTAVLMPINVYKGSIQVGQGFYLIREDGLKSKPTVWPEELEDGDYITTDIPLGQMLVVVPYNKQ